MAASCKSGEGELGGPVDGHEEIELAFLGAHLGDVDVEVADRVALERLLGRLVAVDLRQPADAVALEAAMQGRAGQMRDRRLQGIEAIVERQQRMLAEGDDDRLLLGRQHRRAGRSWAPSARRATKVRFLHLATVLGLRP